MNSFFMAACVGKAAFNNWAEAMRLVRLRNRPQRRKSKADKLPVNAFRCAYCGKWHIGSRRV